MYVGGRILLSQLIVESNGKLGFVYLCVDRQGLTRLQCLEKRFYNMFLILLNKEIVKQPLLLIHDVYSAMNVSLS